MGAAIHRGTSIRRSRSERPGKRVMPAQPARKNLMTRNSYAMAVSRFVESSNSSSGTGIAEHSGQVLRCANVTRAQSRQKMCPQEICTGIENSSPRQMLHLSPLGGAAVFRRRSLTRCRCVYLGAKFSANSGRRMLLFSMRIKVMSARTHKSAMLVRLSLWSWSTRRSIRAISSTRLEILEARV